MNEITSSKNPKIREIISLQKPKERKRTGLMVVEGRREISLALRAGHPLHSVFICSEIFYQDPNYPIDFSQSQMKYSVSRDVFASVAYRESVEGILALFRWKGNTIESWSRIINPLYLIIENVEKPGNLGAMLRTADAAGVNGVIICQPQLDLTNPNIVRSSLGCLFTLPVATTDNIKCFDFLTQRNVTTYAAAISPKSKVYTENSFLGPTAIILGSEADGLSDFWLKNSTHQVIIPMLGQIDSLNVSNAAAVLLYETLRQRTIVR